MVVNAPTAGKLTISLAEFLSRPETTEPTEYLNGEVIVSPAPLDRHQKFHSRLFIAIWQLSHDEGELRSSPCDVHINGNVVQPDIFWVRPTSTQCILGADEYWHGAPDLVVEILSPGTASRDRGEKFDIYEQAGVGEYWLVDPSERTIEVYVWNGKHLARQGLYRPDKTFTSPILGSQTVNLAGILS